MDPNAAAKLSEFRRIARQNAEGHRLASVELANRRRDVVCVVERDHHVQRQHDAAREEAFGHWQRLPVSKPEKLVDGFAAPLDQRANAARLQELLEFIATIGFDLEVLKDIEVIGVSIGCRGQLDI